MKHSDLIVWQEAMDLVTDIYELSIAHGSLMEVETNVEIARRVGYLDEHSARNLFDRSAEVGRLLNALQRALVSRNRSLNPES